MTLALALTRPLQGEVKKNQTIQTNNQQKIPYLACMKLYVKN